MIRAGVAALRAVPPLAAQAVMRTATATAPISMGLRIDPPAGR
jgi:hypothetical protein